MGRLAGSKETDLLLGVVPAGRGCDFGEKVVVVLEAHARLAVSSQAAVVRVWWEQTEMSARS